MIVSLEDAKVSSCHLSAFCFRQIFLLFEIGYNERMKPSPKLKIGVIVFLLIVFFVILNLTGFSKEVKNFFYLISSPIQKILWEAGDKVSDFFEMTSEFKNLKSENEELKFKNQELLAEIVVLEELKKENEALREALNLGLEKDFRLVFAKVIGKNISEDSIFINKGLEDGLTLNLPVITVQKTLVGKISEIDNHFSKVMLISNKESSLNAKISNTDIFGVAKGEGSLKLFLEFIPREAEIKKGDLVMTTSLGGIFPDGLLIGEIKEVKKSDIESFQKAEITPAFDIKEIQNLFIMINF